MVRKEHYHLRDLIFNEIHRGFGEGIFATDLDFLEYRLDKNSIILSALIETKSEYAKINFSRLQHKAQRRLAELANLPYFTVKYIKPDYNVIIYPMNKLAKHYIPIVTAMSLKEYIILLYELRGLRCPNYILSKLEVHHIHETERQYKLDRIKAMEKEIVKLRQEIGLNGYKK